MSVSFPTDAASSAQSSAAGTYAIGIDIGGTKIAAGLVHSDAPTEVRGLRTTATPRADAGTPPGPILDATAELITALISDLDGGIPGTPSANLVIGIGAPGVIDPARGVVVDSGPTMPDWAGADIVNGIATRTGITPAVHNDVRVMGLGETLHGAGENFGSVLFASFGTGVGGAIVRSGQLSPSPHFTAGELRYLSVAYPDGDFGSIEELASGPALTRRFLSAHPGVDQTLNLREIFRQYPDDAREFCHQHMLCAGRGLAELASIIDVEAVIIGGGIGNLGEIILDPLRQGFREAAAAPLANIPVLQAQLGTDAPIVGAAALARNAS